MKKLAAYIFLITTLPFTALASQHVNLHNSNFDGFYADFGVGLVSTQFDMNNTSLFSTTGAGALSSTSSDIKSAQQHFIGGQFGLGYGRAFSNHFYAGLFGFIDLSQHKNNNVLNMQNVGGGSSIVDLKSSTTELGTVTGGLSFKPGWQLTPHTLFYGLIGWQHAVEKINANHFVRITTAAQGLASGRESVNMNGLHLGVGFLQQIAPALMFGVSYSLTDYFSNPALNIPTQNTTGGALTGPFSYSLGHQRVFTQAVLAQLVYYFGLRPRFFKLAYLNPKNMSGLYLASRIGALNPSTSGDDSAISGVFTDGGAFVNQPTLTSSLPGDSAASMLSLSLGLAHVYDKRFYLGMAASIDWSNNNVASHVRNDFRPVTVSGGGQTPDSIVHQANVKSWDFQPNLDLKIGAFLIPRLLSYFRIGVGVNKVNLDTRDQLSYINQNTNRSNLTLMANTNNGVRAFLRLGAGVEYQFSKGNVFTLNYLFTDYGHFSVNQTSNATDAAGNPVSITDNTKLNYCTNTMTVGFSHYF